MRFRTRNARASWPSTSRSVIATPTSVSTPVTASGSTTRSSSSRSRCLMCAASWRSSQTFVIPSRRRIPSARRRSSSEPQCLCAMHSTRSTAWRPERPSRHAARCARVTEMQVARLGVDAAVLYADIMLPLDGMGVPFHIEPELGPIVERPLRDRTAVEALRVITAEEATPYLFETIRALRRSLPPDVALIGFCGGPFTLASYLIEGRPSRDHARAKSMLQGDPALWSRLMDTLVEVL